MSIQNTVNPNASRLKLTGVHPESCMNCRLWWYNESYYGEGTYMGEAGHICDGPHPGKANLKGFPFMTKQKCFHPTKGKSMNIENPTIRIHFIDNSLGNIILTTFAKHVPRAGDEIRIGGPGNEVFYMVCRLVWAYDESESPIERVNIGVTRIQDKDL